MEELPVPLVSAGVSMRGLTYMPLHIDRLQKSKTWLICKRLPHLAFHVMNMWMRCWAEEPAASLEDDDDVLADAAMCSPDKWQEIKTSVLRGWTLCNDGRWYHPVVAEIATEVWEKRTDDEKKKAADRQRKRDRRSGGSPADTARTDTGKAEETTAIPAENALKKKTEEDSKEGVYSRARAPDVSVEVQAVVGAWRQIANGADCVIPGERTAIAASIRRNGFDVLLEVCAKARASPRLNGKEGVIGVMPLNWLWDDEKIARVRRGQYDGNRNSNADRQPAGVVADFQELLDHAEELDARDARAARSDSEEPGRRLIGSR